MKTKKIVTTMTAVAALVSAMPLTVLADEINPDAYAVLDMNTLSFYCDNEMDTREGYVVSMPEFDAVIGSEEDIPWSIFNVATEQVIFDESFENYNPSSTAYWFKDFANLSEVINCGNLDMSDVTEADYMFDGCTSLENLDASEWDLNNIVSSDEMFEETINVNYEAVVIEEVMAEETAVEIEVTEEAIEVEEITDEDINLEDDDTCAVIADENDDDGMCSLTYNPNDPIQKFVYNAYFEGLLRIPDQAGFDNYVNALKNKKMTGAQFIHSILFSAEYKNFNWSNYIIVDDYYVLLLGRFCTSAENANWRNALNSGSLTKEQVFASFANSQEFYNRCKQYGIVSGYYVANYDNNKQGNINAFVARLYETCLGRTPDMDGQKNWVNGILFGGISGSTAVRNFLLSQELTNKNLNNTQFVTTAYMAFFGRTPDATGLRNWVNALNNGMSRESMFSGFKDSQEFKNLCASYGINP